MSKFNSSNTFPGDKITLRQHGPIKTVVNVHDTFVVCFDSVYHVEYCHIVENISYDTRYTRFMEYINRLHKL